MKQKIVMLLKVRILRKGRRSPNPRDRNGEG